MPFLPDPDNEISAIDQFNLNRQRIQSYATQATPTQAHAVGGIANYWPTISPGAALALGKQGYTPFSPISSTVADLETRRQARSGFAQPGGKTKAKRKKKKPKKNDDDEGGGFLGLGIGPDIGPDIGKHIPIAGAVSAAAKGDIGEALVRSVPGASAVAEVEGKLAGQASKVPLLGKPVEYAADVLKPVARAGFVGLNTPLELAQAGVRTTAQSFADAGKALGKGDLGGALENAAIGAYGIPTMGVSSILSDVQHGDPMQQIAQTTAGQAGMALASGEKVDLGTGYLPGMNTEIAKKQAAAARKYGPTIDGHAFTLGRFYASRIFEPDSTEFNIVSGLIDASVAIKGDPGGLALQGMSLPGTAKKFAAYDAAGLVQGARKGVLRKTTAEWYAGSDGVKVRNFLRDESSPYRIWKKTNKKLPVQTQDGSRFINELADATTDEEIDSILRPVLGLEIEGPPKVGGLGYQFKHATRDVRMLARMPGHKLDPNDLDSAAENLENWLINGKVPEEEREVLVNKILRAESGKERIAVGEAAADAVKRQLIRRGASERKAHAATRLYPERVSEGSKYFVDEIGNNGWDPMVAIGGEARPLPSPHLLSEQLAGPVPLPDARKIRRMASVMAQLDVIPGVNAARSAAAGGLDAFMDFWRELHLLRPAWTVRIIGDEQLRIAATGHDSMFRHPLSYFAVVAGAKPDSRLYKMMQGASEKLEAVPLGVGKTAARKVAPVGEADIAGGPLFSELNDASQEALMSSFGAFRPQERALGQWDTIQRGHEDYARGLAGEIQQLRADRLAQKVLEEADPAVVKAAFWDGDLKKYREQLSATEDMARALQTRQGADLYIDSVYRRIEIKTAGDDRLREAIRTGKVGDQPLMKNGEVNKRAVRQIENMDVGPEKVKIQKYLTLRDDLKSEDLSRLNRGVDVAFDWFMTKPSNTFSRGPEYSQLYWDRAPELVGHLDEAGKQKLLDAARQSNMPDSVIGTIASQKTADELGRKAITFEVADKVIQKHALDGTKQLLYDLSERNQFFDVFKLLFPFGDAWKEIVTRWSKIAVENPVVFQRGQQIVQGARGAGFFRQGSTGEEVFTYPGSEFLTDKLLGTPIPLTGRVNGLNMMGEGLPGVGPVVSIPAAYFLPDSPEYDDLANVIYPYGSPVTGDPATSILDALIPSWGQKIRVFLDDSSHPREWNNTVMDVARYLASTGEYDLQGEPRKEHNRLLKDAKEKARWFYLIRGLSQSTLPSSPAPEWQIKDPEGRLVLTQKVVNEYRKRQEKDGYDEALDWFIDTYGDENFLVPQAKSRVLVGSAPVTKAGSDWARAHPKVVAKFPQTYGYFAPQEGKFDITAYQRQFERGERKMLTVEEMSQEANNRIASHHYKKLRDKLPQTLNDTQRKAMKQIREVMADAYPGFDTIPYDDKKVPNQIRELESAVKEPSLRRTDAGQALAVYLKIRKKAMQAAEKLGVGIGSAKKTAPLRTALRASAEAIIDEYPDFNPLWDFVFSRELADDPEEKGLPSGS